MPDAMQLPEVDFALIAARTRPTAVRPTPAGGPF